MQAYLDRIEVPREEAQVPSLELLQRLQLAHLLHIPFDTTSLHVPEGELRSPPHLSPRSQHGGLTNRGAGILTDDWYGDESKTVTIHAPGARTMLLGDGALDRLTRLRRGGYCFSTNAPFARLLRALGFRVTELSGKVYKFLGDHDPNEKGWAWGPTSHETLVVDCDGRRYFVDVGFGGGQPTAPIELRDGASNVSPLSEDEHMLRHEVLPGHDAAHAHDLAKGWTLYRRVKSTDVWTPMHHSLPLAISPQDFVVLNHYNATHPDAVFVSCLVVTLLLPDGRRRTLMAGTKTSSGESIGQGAQLQETGRDRVAIPMETHALRTVLERDFGFCFPPR